MVRKTFAEFAIDILSRIIAYDLPFELNFDDFNNKMQILLSKQNTWLALWSDSYPSVEKLIESIKRSKPFIDFQKQLKLIYIFLGFIIAVSLAFSFINPAAFIIIPIIGFIFVFILFYKKKILYRKFSEPYRVIIEKYLKNSRGNLIKLVKYIKKHVEHT